MPEPLPRELNLQGEVAAIVVAETEDLAQDAADAIKVTYDVLPFASLLKDSMAANAPDLGHGQGNLHPPFFSSPTDLPNVTWGGKAWRHRNRIRRSGRSEGIQLPLCGRRFRADAAERQRGQMGRRQTDRVGHGPGNLSGARDACGGARHGRFQGPCDQQMERLHVRRGAHGGGEILSDDRPSGESHRPARESHALPKDQELAQLQIKPETITKFRVGAKKTAKSLLSITK